MLGGLLLLMVRVSYTSCSEAVDEGSSEVAWTEESSPAPTSPYAALAKAVHIEDERQQRHDFIKQRLSQHSHAYPGGTVARAIPPFDPQHKSFCVYAMGLPPENSVRWAHFKGQAREAGLLNYTKIWGVEGYRANLINTWAVPCLGLKHSGA